MNQSLFRDSSLKKIQSPEHLNDLLQVSSPGLWSIVISVSVLLLTGLIWAMTGSISDTVHTEGVVFPQNGVEIIRSAEGGQVRDVLIMAGDSVDAGMTVAVMAQDVLLDQIEVWKADPDVNRVLIDDLQADYGNKSLIRSQVSGKVISAAKAGDFIEPGQEIARVVRQARYANDHQVICYMPAALAKRLSVGMEAQVSPDFAPREEYGYMIGVIVSISPYPVSQEEIETAVGSLATGMNIRQDTSLMEVRINLALDSAVPGTQARMLWSNPKGRFIDISMGTLCKVQIIVSRRTPIQLMLGQS